MSETPKYLSPLTAGGDTRLIRKIPTSQIIDSYRNIGINVERFFANIEHVEIRKCQVTNYRYYHPFSIFGDSAFYVELAESRENYYHPRWEHHTALNYLPKDGRLLEIGCGSGIFLEMVAQHTHLERIGIDWTKSIIDSMKSKINFFQGDIFGFQGEKESFDVICAFQVLEHIADVENFMKKCMDLLKANGKIIIGVPNNNPYLFKYDDLHALNLPPHHAGLWNKKAFEGLSRKFNLEIEVMLTEPLFEKEYYYNVQLDHWQKKLGVPIKKIINFHSIFKRISKKIILAGAEGRNIFVVLKKEKNDWKA